MEDSPIDSVEYGARADAGELSGKELSGRTESVDVADLEDGRVRWIGSVPERESQIVRDNVRGKGRVCNHGLEVRFVRDEHVPEIPNDIGPGS